MKALKANENVFEFCNIGNEGALNSGDIER